MVPVLLLLLLLCYIYNIISYIIHTLIISNITNELVVRENIEVVKLGELRSVSMLVSGGAGSSVDLLFEKRTRIKAVFLTMRATAMIALQGLQCLLTKHKVLALGHNEVAHIAHLSALTGFTTDGGQDPRANVFFNFGDDYFEVEEDGHVYLCIQPTTGNMTAEAIIYYEEV